jgi:hypothetical protein
MTAQVRGGGGGGECMYDGCVYEGVGVCGCGVGVEVCVCGWECVSQI